MSRLDEFKKQYQRLHDMIDGNIPPDRPDVLLARCGKMAEALIVELPDSTPIEDKAFMVEALEFLHGLAAHIIKHYQNLPKN